MRSMITFLLMLMLVIQFSSCFKRDEDAGANSNGNGTGVSTGTGTGTGVSSYNSINNFVIGDIKIITSADTNISNKDLKVAACHQLDSAASVNEKGEFSLNYPYIPKVPNLLCISGPLGIGKLLLKFPVNEGTIAATPSHMPEGLIIHAEYPVKTTVNLLYFNDVHGAIDNFPKVAALIKKIRSENKNTYVLNAGDNFSGNPIVDQYEERGKPIFDLFNAISLDFMAQGNHDFDFGQEVLLKRAMESKFPIFGANIKVQYPDLVKIFFPASGVFQTSNQLKIAIVSAIETSNQSSNGILPSTLAKNVVGLKFSDPVEELKNYDLLKESSKANMMIGLTHIGAESDYKLAAETKNYDVIIGGHSHTLIKKETIINNSLVAQAGDYLKYLGKITVIFENDRIHSKKNELIEVKKLTEEDPEVKNMVDKFNNNPTLNQTIGVAEENISGKDELGSLITDSMLSVHNADIAFQNGGGIRIPVLNKGNISLKNAYELLPFGNEIVLLKMTAKEIRSLIAVSFNKRSSIDLQVAGIRYVVRVKNVEGSGGVGVGTGTGIGTAMAIESIDLFNLNDNQLLSEDRTYLVAINDYVASSYIFEHSDLGASTSSADNQALIKFIKSRGKLNYKGVKRALVEKN
ncbi:MAG: bifunctional metallophosphatase/5'-nucleotidase [Oligoflexia bacterium]|nr:bifunctional metallophosphatase/5'-nucleotidase [Oligoflexia bacterium]